VRYPDWIEMAWMALATLRLWQLVAEDEITERPREWVIDRTPDWVDPWLVCPWCSGFWIGGVVWASWWWWPTATLAALTPFILSMIVGLIRVTQARIVDR
jgi:hypothetical protein